MTLQLQDTLPEPAVTLRPVGNDSLLHSLAQTYHEVTAVFERFMGMSRPRWALLSLLSREGEASQATLAQRLRVDAAAITRQVQQLEMEALLTRRADPADNRVMLVALTPTGQAFVAELRSQRDAFEDIATAGLSMEEVAFTRRCLLHIRDNLQTLPR